jgi:inner membrane protein
LEPLTHFLTGACISRAGLNRKTALATSTLVLSAEAPDIDVLASLHGRIFGFAHHRGITHTLLGVLMMAAVVLGVVWLLYKYALWRRKKNFDEPPRWGLLFSFACLGGLSHILLDFTNNYGVRPFDPFFHKWYSWDIVFIVEPVILLFLILALVTPWFLGLIHSEIGMRRKGPRGRVAAIVALSGIVFVWLVRDFEHRRAVAALQARIYDGAEPIRVSAFPTYINPFSWGGVVETRDFFQTMRVDSLAPEIDPDNRAQTFYKPEETPVTLAAKKSYLGRVYLDWAQYPMLETEKLEPPYEGYLVRFYDLRFLFPERPGRRPLSSFVVLDRNLNVVAERMGVAQQPKENR